MGEREDKGQPHPEPEVPDVEGQMTMGYMRHHALVVTSWDKERLREVYEAAVRIFPMVSEILLSEINGYSSFFVPPDGSKEGWEESDRGDRRRNEFVEALAAYRTEDGGSYIDWAEVQYGDYDGDIRVVRSDVNPEQRSDCDGGRA